TIKGSDTMVHLVTGWAEAYMKAHPEAEISVTGGGSGTGIAAMINGTTGLCMASREVKSREEEQAKSRGIRFHEITVARDGIAVVVNPQNAVSELTLDQLRQVFNGTLQSWSQIGGVEQAIQILSRESNSGTYVFFNEHVLQKDDYGPKVRLMPSNAAIVQSVGQDRWSIGYVGLGYAQGAPVKVIQVKPDPSSPAVQPSLATVRDRSYPIARPLYLYSNGEPSGLARAFADFALSAEGQGIVREIGYIPLR
ncbi:MAG: phosphate ABC transporter substrate-binding protein, partial [Planctomycetota bacterium]